MNLVQNVVILFYAAVSTDDVEKFNIRMSSKLLMKTFILSDDFPAATREFRFEY